VRVEHAALRIVASWRALVAPRRSGRCHTLSVRRSNSYARDRGERRNTTSPVLTFAASWELNNISQAGAGEATRTAQQFPRGSGGALWMCRKKSIGVRRRPDGESGMEVRQGIDRDGKSKATSSAAAERAQQQGRIGEPEDSAESPSGCPSQGSITIERSGTSASNRWGTGRVRKEQRTR